jgi:hypothetical protein
MTTLSENVKRNFEFGADPLYNDIPVIAADIIYEGAAVGESGSAGTARPLVAADTFLGFAAAKADNAAGSASAINVRVRERGRVQLAVTGVVSTADVGATVYADDDDSFTLTSSSNTAIGKIVRWVTSTTVIVAFESAQQRSI